MGADIQTINFNDNIQPKVQTNFRAQTTSVQNYPYDTVEINGKTKAGMSAEAKVGIGLGIITAIGIAIACMYKHRRLPVGNDLEKFYSKNAKLSQLAEHIDFKEAKTVEEGIEFIRKNFGISSISKFKNRRSEKLTIEEINWINKGLTDVCNTNKGKLLLPKKIIFQDIPNNSRGGMLLKKGDSFGKLLINTNYFDHNYLNKQIEDMFKDSIKSKNYLIEYNMPDIYSNLIKKAKLDINSLSLSEKQKLCDIYQKFMQKSVVYEVLNPSLIIKNNINEFKKAGIDINIKKLSEINNDVELDKEVKSLLQKYFDKTGKKLSCKIDTTNDFQTIYHEMGHLQDIALNWRKYIKNNGNAQEDHFVSVFKPEAKKLYKENPIEFKKKYPQAYEFLTNTNIQNTAGEVSWYATTGIGEFIADTYAKMVAGESISDDVIALYKKYNGPLPKGFK